MIRSPFIEYKLYIVWGFYLGDTLSFNRKTASINLSIICRAMMVDLTQSLNLKKVVSFLSDVAKFNSIV